MTGVRFVGAGVIAAALTLASVSPASAQSAPAAGAPAAPRAVDVLSDVTVTANRAATADVMATRLSRFVNSRCFLRSADDPDPTATFNKAYYTELTGQADLYDTIRPPPPPRRSGRMRAMSATGPNVFRNLDGPMPIPGGSNGAGFRADPSRGCQASGARNAAGKNTTFARALAHYDKLEFDQALPLFKQAREELGFVGLGAEAALMIGKMYLAGQGTTKDAKEGAYWLAKTLEAREQVPDSPFNYGVRPARYDPKDPNRYYKVAAEAAMLLAGLYASGDGVPVDPKLARQWLGAAEREGHVPAVKILGDMFHYGYGGDQNLGKALTYYDAAGGMRHAAAKYEAGGMHERGESVAVSLPKALQLYREAAVLGDADAAYVLALAYDNGKGVAADPQKALGFYKDAALGKNAAAQTAVGTYFYEGGLVEKNLPVARAWFNEAATGGDPDAMVNLAAMLIKGEGGPADPMRAWAWLTLARKGGREDVAPGIANLQARLKPEELVAARALVGG